MKTKYRAVQGKLPRKNEVAEWSQEKLYALVLLVEALTKEGKYEITGETRKAVEMNDNPFWEEFLIRIDRPFGKANNVQFKMRFTTLVRVALSWLKSNPFAISEEMRVIMKKNPRLAWALNAFQVTTTDIGAEIVTVNNREETDPAVANVSASSNVTLPEAQYNQALLNLASILSNLTKGISQNELKKLGVEDRIKLANTLLKTLGQQFNKYKPNSMVFKQLNIHNASKDDLEKAFTEYNENQ
jgi:hypothetical protein